MKFVRGIQGKGVAISPVELKLAKFEDAERVEVHVLDHAVVVLQSQMTAVQLLNAAHQLQELSSELLLHLAKCCGFCTGCEEDCPYTGKLEEGYIQLPDYLREKAGIPSEAKLCACVDKEEGTVIISPAEYRHNLQDVPKELIDLFLDNELCLRELERVLMEEAIVYAG